MPRVVVDGVGLNVVDLGASGRRVVMLHGLLLGNLATWYFGAAPVLAATHRVRLYDLRGHGRSDRPPTGYDLDTMAADLDALVDDASVDLVGHSYGGLVALRWALDHPGRVRRLVVVDTPLPPTAPAEIAAFLHRSPEAMVEALPAGLADAVAGGRRQARRLVAHLAALATETTVLTDLPATRRFDDAELARLDAALLAVYGEASSCLDSGRHLAATCPHARLVTLPGGHYLHLDAADALTAHLVEHLDG